LVTIELSLNGPFRRGYNSVGAPPQRRGLCGGASARRSKARRMDSGLRGPTSLPSFRRLAALGAFPFPGRSKRTLQTSRCGGPILGDTTQNLTVALCGIVADTVPTSTSMDHAQEEVFVVLLVDGRHSLIRSVDHQNGSDRSVRWLVDDAIEHSVVHVTAEWFGLIGELQQRDPHLASAAGLDRHDGRHHRRGLRRSPRRTSGDTRTALFGACYGARVFVSDSPAFTSATYVHVDDKQVGQALRGLEAAFETGFLTEDRPYSFRLAVGCIA
jgi:hypothetical protein